MGVSGGPYIVRDSSLVLELDAADRNSYVSASAIWNDISGNSYSATLNNVSYNTNNQGNFIWDNSLDSITFGTSLGLTYLRATVSFWMRTTDTRFVVFSRFGSPYLGAVHVGGNGNGAWYHSAVGSPIAYTNGIVSSGPNFNGTWNYYTFTDCNFLASSDWNLSGITLFYYSGGWEFETGSLATFSIYNRSLNQQEILQNYNAQKSRFGLK